MDIVVNLIAIGLVDWYCIGRQVMNWRIGDGLAGCYRIGVGQTYWQWIGRFAKDWHWIGQRLLDWRIGHGLADWSWIGRLVMDWQISHGLADWSWIGRLVMDWQIGDANWFLIDIGLAVD